MPFSVSGTAMEKIEVPQLELPRATLHHAAIKKPGLVARIRSPPSSPVRVFRIHQITHPKTSLGFSSLESWPVVNNL